jgi:hypothetical protein
MHAFKLETNEPSTQASTKPTAPLLAQYSSTRVGETHCGYATKL